MNQHRPVRVALIDPRLVPQREQAALRANPRAHPAVQAKRRPAPLAALADRRSPFLRFCMIGALGFVVDAGTLFGLIERFGVAPLPARVVSILFAVTVTWALHRRWTFRSDDPERLAEWSRFLTVSLAGAALNYAIYAAVLLGVPGTPPLLALAMGSVLALAANYAGARLWAFRPGLAG